MSPPIAFMGSEIMMVTAQEKLTNQINSTNSAKQTIIITWLEANKSKAESDPVISISNEDFWKTFGPLVEQSSFNGSTLSTK